MPESEDRLRDEEREAAAVSPSAARLFDVRRVIGGLFTVYGVIVTVVGVADSGAALTKAGGVRINLWVGLAMLLLGLLFLIWQWLRPASLTPSSDQSPDQPPGRSAPDRQTDRPS
jgi:predicted phage tail protein